MVEALKIMVISFKRSHEGTAILSAPNPAASHHQLMPPPDIPGHSQASLGQCLVGHFFLGPGAHKVLFVPSKSLFSTVLCKFWQLYGGVNGDLLQEGLCHTQVYCTQRPCPHSSPLLTYTSLGDIQTVLSQSLWSLWVLVCTRYV